MAGWSKWLTKSSSLKLGLNLWPPFFFSGIHVDKVSHDFRLVQVSLRDRVFNRNYVGTHFGGSLFSMLDPFFMIMVMRNLGSRYYVWDRSGEIDFISPGRGIVRSNLTLNELQIEDLIKKCASGSKAEPIFETEIVNQAGETIARYRKKLYVRLKPQYRPQ